MWSTASSRVPGVTSKSPFSLPGSCGKRSALLSTSWSSACQHKAGSEHPRPIKGWRLNNRMRWVPRRLYCGDIERTAGLGEELLSGLDTKRSTLSGVGAGVVGVRSRTPAQFSLRLIAAVESKVVDAVTSPHGSSGQVVGQNCRVSNSPGELQG